MRDHARLDASAFRALEEHFSRPELVEIIAFSAWQSGGPRMLSSWRAEQYKRGARPVLAELPVRLAYERYANDPPGRPYEPRLPGEPAEAIIARAELNGSPPAGWLRFLAAHPRVLEAWDAFYTTLFEGGVLPRRLKQMVRVRMALTLDCPQWAPADGPRLRELGIGPLERQAVERYDPDVLTPAEIAALAYAELMASGAPLEDETFAPVVPHFSEPQRVELGFVVAIQAGAIRAFRWLSRIGELAAVGGRTAVPIAPLP